MRLKLRRRSVYIATIVTMLATVAGLAIGAYISTIATGGQNGYSVTSAAGTSYATGTPTTNLVWTTAPACTASGTVSPASNVADVYVAGEVACQTATADWFEEISFPGTALVANPADNFAVTVGANSPITFAVDLTTTSGHAIQTNIYYEVGTSATATTSDIGITGD